MSVAKVTEITSTSKKSLKMPLKMALSVQIKHLNTSLAHGLQTNQCPLKVEKLLLTMFV